MNVFLRSEKFEYIYEIIECRVQKRKICIIENVIFVINMCMCTPYTLAILHTVYVSNIAHRIVSNICTQYMLEILLTYTLCAHTHFEKTLEFLELESFFFFFFRSGFLIWEFFYLLRTFCPYLVSFCVVSTFRPNFTSGLLQVIYRDASRTKTLRKMILY